MTDPMQVFRDERLSRIDANARNASLREASKQFLVESIRSSYSYNFECLSRPIIQYPQDVVAMQELIWRIRPDLIIETGIAHGGSLVMSASMLALIDYCDAVVAGTFLDPTATLRRVVGIDIDIRPHNRTAIEAHPMGHRIDMIQGSSTDPNVIDRVRGITKGHNCVLVCLDSNHTHEHVVAELEAYAPFVSMGSYCVVFDTIVEQMPDDLFLNRPWSHGNNPMTAVQQFLSSLAVNEAIAADGERLLFEIDSAIDHKLLISVAPHGYLRRVEARAANI
jgi:cephalosporin hydroxylase